MADANDPACIQAYKNVEKFAKWRGLAIESEPYWEEPGRPPIETINRVLSATGQWVVRLKSEADPDEKTVLYIISPTSEHNSKSAKLRELLKTANHLIEGGTLRGVILFVLETTAQKEALREVVHSHETAETRYEIHPYHILATVVPEYGLVPKHEIMAEDDVQELLKVYFLQRGHLPHIPVTDPPLVWIGAKKGDVIRVTRRSETAGRAVSYRYVV